MNFWFLLRPSFMFAFVGILFFIVFGYMHEQAHVQIYKNWNVESKIDLIHYAPDFVTIAENATNCNDYCELAHSINESIGYQLEIVYILVFVGLFILILLLESNKGIF